MDKRLEGAKTKMLFLCFFSLLLFYSVIWVTFDIFLFRPLKEERNQYITDYAHQISLGVSEQKEVYKKIVLQLCSNYVLVENLSESYEKPIEIWKAMENINQILKNNKGIMPSIQKLAVYVQGSSLWSNGLYIFTKDISEREFTVDYEWFPEKEKGTSMYSICSEVVGLYNSVEAYIKLSVNVQRAFGGYINFDDGIDGRAYLVDKDGFIIASSQPFEEGKRPEELIGGMDEEIPVGHILETHRDVILRQQIDEDWSVVVVLPAAYTKKKMQNTYLIISVIMLGIAIVTGLVLFRMIKKWYDALEEVTAVKIQKQKFEVRSLESQINPHFLYNTLGVMRWEAMDCKSQKLMGMIDNLTIFYRRSLNKGNSFLTVSQEIELVRAYIAIQEERCDNCVQVQIEMDPEMENVIIPKMILQPLVENIWMHGNITKPGSQYIKISIHKLDQELFQILVIDNGSGISKERMEQITSNGDENGSGIGVSYIRSILRCYYGDSFIYDIRSREGEGTRVSLILPNHIKGEGYDTREGGYESYDY